MDVYDKLLASYDPIDYMYTVFEKPNPNEEECKRMFFLFRTAPINKQLKPNISSEETQKWVSSFFI